MRGTEHEASAAAPLVDGGVGSMYRRRTETLTLFRFRVTVNDTASMSLIISATSSPSALSPLTATIVSPTLKFASRSAMEPASIFVMMLLSVRWMPSFSPLLSTKSAVLALRTPPLPSGYFSSSGVSSCACELPRILLNQLIAAPAAPGSEPVQPTPGTPATGEQERRRWRAVSAGRAWGGVLHGRGSSRGLFTDPTRHSVLFTAGVPHHVRIANLMVTLPAGVGSRAALARVPPPQALNHHPQLHSYISKVVCMQRRVLPLLSCLFTAAVSHACVCVST